MITSLLHILLQTSRIDWSVVGSILLSFAVYLAFTLLFDAVCVNCIPYESPYKVSFRIFRQGRFWFLNIFVVILALLPRFIVKGIYNTLVNPLNKDFSKTRTIYLWFGWIPSESHWWKVINGCFNIFCYCSTHHVIYLLIKSETPVRRPMLLGKWRIDMWNCERFLPLHHVFFAGEERNKFRNLASTI